MYTYLSVNSMGVPYIYYTRITFKGFGRQARALKRRSSKQGSMWRMEPCAATTIATERAGAARTWYAADWYSPCSRPSAAVPARTF